MKKHSVSIAGHRTSISLEAPFWDELNRIAQEEGRSLASLIAEIDRDRIAQRSEPRNLSSALRLHVLQRLQEEKNRALGRA